MDLLWQKTQHVFPILHNTLEAAPIEKEEIDYVIQELLKLDLLEHIYETVLLEISKMLRTNVVPNFWKNFQGIQRVHAHDAGDANVFNTKEKFHQFKNSVLQLYEDYQKFKPLIERLQMISNHGGLKKNENQNQNMAQKFDRIFRSDILSQLPTKFNDIAYAFYSTSFKVFAKYYTDDVEEDTYSIEDDMKCRGCDNDTEKCKCEELVTAFSDSNRYLNEMGLLDRIAGYTLTTLIQHRINSHVQDKCRGTFDVSHIQSLERWLNSVVLNWLTRIYNRGSLSVTESDEKITFAVKNFQIKLNFYLYEVYANTIIDQFFNIIVDFPESQPAIEDLKVCLDKLDLRNHLIKSLKNALETRLLHPGVDTSDILTGYVTAIKAIRHLDNNGILLQTVTEPIKDYLRRRTDTVRCVVTALTEEGPTELAEELAKSEAQKAEEIAAAKDEMSHWEEWCPDPVDVDLAKSSRNNRPADIISMVVDIYGSKELFVNEYRSLLAERLLLQMDFNAEKEIRNLELLKLRFGETLLHSCEVMLKDISDSKRINYHIHTDNNYNEGKTFEISALIVSSQFWPTFKKETMELPEEIKHHFGRYTKSYESHKGNRTLHWTPLNGKVDIEIEIDEKVLKLCVSPVQATIIIHFQNQSEWELEKLSHKMNVPPSILRKRLTFWQTRGLIREVKDNYFILIDKNTAVEDMNEMHSQTQEICDDDENESAMASASDQREEELQVFWSYIEAMLTNLDSLPLERIHQMLKMFASQGPGYEFSQDELKSILQRKVREHKLIYTGGVYHLPK